MLVGNPPAWRAFRWRKLGFACPKTCWFAMPTARVALKIALLRLPAKRNGAWCTRWAMCRGRVACGHPRQGHSNRMLISPSRACRPRAKIRPVSWGFRLYFLAYSLIPHQCLLSDSAVPRPGWPVHRPARCLRGRHGPSPNASQSGAGWCAPALQGAATGPRF